MSVQRKRDLLVFGADPRRYSWHGLGLLAFIYLGALLFAAIVAPPVYWLIEHWAAVSPNPLNAYLISKDFPDYFDRLRWAPLVVMLAWLLRVSGLNSWRALGLHTDSKGLRMSAIGFAAGIGLLSAAAAVHIFGTDVRIKNSIDCINGGVIVFRALAGGLILGILEEIVFRGLVFRIFYTAFSPIWAVGLSAAFFAYVHFEMSDVVWEQSGGHVNWRSSFFVGYGTLFAIFGQQGVLLRFINLALLSVVLTLLFLKRRSLMPCIGLHAGLVTTLLTYQKFTQDADSAQVWLWGSDSLVDGLPVLFMLTVLTAGLLKSLRRTQADARMALQR